MGAQKYTYKNTISQENKNPMAQGLLYTVVKNTLVAKAEPALLIMLV